MRVKFWKSVFMAAILLLPVKAIADSNKPAKFFPVANAKTLLVPVAQHMRVDEGVFELEMGKTIDLTDRKILLSIRGKRKDCCYMFLNGTPINRIYSRPGRRFNLKDETSTEKFVEDKDVCFLDILDIALPKGVPGIVTFRLHCL